MKEVWARNFLSETKRNKEGNMKSSYVKLQNVGVNQTLITTLKNVRRKKQFQHVTRQLRRQQIRRQIIVRQIFFNRIFPV